MSKKLSIITEDWEHCFICSVPGQLEIHHVMKGSANRKISERYLLKVPLCPCCHRTGKKAVHKCRDTDLWLIKEGQKAFEECYSKELWFELFKKNYL